MGTPAPATMSVAKLVANDVDHGVTVEWTASTIPADDAIRAHVARVVAVDPGSVQVGRLCGRCGSTAHGRPWASHGVHVSLARSGPHLVTAVSTTGPVGVDVESVAGVDLAWDDVSSLLASESVTGGSGRAAFWCRTEALLKRDGTGFTVPPDRHRLERGIVDDLVAPAGYCAAVAYDGR
jgi:4'-phosphopantetheinyl transferase